MKQIIEETNRTLRGWFELLQTQHCQHLPRPGQMDARTTAHASCASDTRAKGELADAIIRRWPNAYFAELGLISLALARAQAANAHKETH